MDRIDRDALLMVVAHAVALRGTCNRKKVGAVISLDGRPLSWGYSGSAPGQPHCLDVGCLIGEDGGCIRTQHAEANAISWAARYGIRLEESTLYVTLAPCHSCAKLIVPTGISRVVYHEPYRVKTGLEFLQDASVEVIRYTGPRLPEVFAISACEHDLPSWDGFSIFEGDDYR